MLLVETTPTIFQVTSNRMTSMMLSIRKFGITCINEKEKCTTVITKTIST